MPNFCNDKTFERYCYSHPFLTPKIDHSPSEHFPIMVTIHIKKIARLLPNLLECLDWGGVKMPETPLFVTFCGCPCSVYSLQILNMLSKLKMTK